MVWNYVFANDTDSVDFDPQLLQSIKEKNNQDVECSLKNSENLCYAVDSSGASLLHYAAECGNDIVAKLLIESGSNINSQDQKGQTPLILATKKKHKSMIRLLLENDADMYVCDNNGVSALFLAVHESLADFVDLIRPFLVEIKYDCCSCSMEYDAIEIAERLSKVDCPFYIAARFKNTDVLRCMLSKGASIEDADPMSKYTALHYAVEYLGVESFKFLVDQGADVNALDVKKRTPLALMKSNGEDWKYYTLNREKEILKILLKKGANLTTITEDGYMQMYWLLTKGSCEILEIVLQSGVDLQARDSHGRNAINYLAKNVHWGHAVTALESRVSTHLERSMSCLEYLKSMVLDDKTYPETESEIIEWDACDKDGRTALHYAMADGNVAFVRYLMTKDVDVNTRSHNGMSPFLEAVNSLKDWNIVDLVSCVELIIEHDTADLAAEIERYFGTGRGKSAINRHFPLLRPVLAVLVLEEIEGELIPEKVIEVIEAHEKLKGYVDFCRKELRTIDGSKSVFDDERFGIFYKDI